MERRVGALRKRTPYKKRYDFVPMARISPNLQHAVVAAEDGRFRKHHGFDWVEMEKVLEQDIQRHKIGRGGSTITQQLVKNLFLTTERSFVRKGVEFSLVPMVETLLSKDRILELYLNVIEWGPGIYGAEAASEYYYRVHASELNREQSARLAAVIPGPLKRKPAQMNEYSAGDPGSNGEDRLVKKQMHRLPDGRGSEWRERYRAATVRESVLFLTATQTC